MKEKLEVIREALEYAAETSPNFNIVHKTERAIKKVNEIIAELDAKKKRKWELGLIEFQTKEGLSEELHYIKHDCEGWIADLHVNDFQKTLEKYGYEVNIYKPINSNKR